MKEEIKDKIFENIKEKEIKRSIKLHLKKYSERFINEGFYNYEQKFKEFIDFDRINEDLINGEYYKNKNNNEYYFYYSLDFEKINNKDIDILINYYYEEINKDACFSSIKRFAELLFDGYAKKKIEGYVYSVEYSLLNW